MKRNVTSHFGAGLLALIAFSPARAGESLPLFPEPQRFPETYFEAALPRRTSAGAAVVFLVPVQRRDVHLRGCAVLGARFGQVYDIAERDCQVALLPDWSKQVTERNGIVIARRDELGDFPLPQRVSGSLSALSPGQGLLGEFILGSSHGQRRWLLVSGADDAGVEKAILTLGSVTDLATAAPNPAIIEADPVAAQPVASNNAEARKDTTELNQIPQLLVRDPSLRRAAFVLPANTSLDEVQFLFDLAFDLGRKVAPSPVVWPEAVTYSKGSFPPAARVQGRSVILLGAVGQWHDALPRDGALVLAIPDRDVAFIQGRKHAISKFEPTLVFAQLIPSPWSRGETVLAVGGWEHFATPAASRLLTDPATINQLYAQLCAMDASGRKSVYDTQHFSRESFAERIQRNIPAGLGVEETRQKLAEYETQLGRSASLNRLVFLLGGSILALLTLGRVLLLWQIARTRRSLARDEKPLGSPQ